VTGVPARGPGAGRGRADRDIDITLVSAQGLQLRTGVLALKEVGRVKRKTYFAWPATAHKSRGLLYE